MASGTWDSETAVSTFSVSGIAFSPRVVLVSYKGPSGEYSTWFASSASPYYVPATNGVTISSDGFTFSTASSIMYAYWIAFE